MKTKIMCLLYLVMNGLVVAQNPYWVFPPNYVDFKTGQVKTLPANMSYTKTASDISNGFFSQNGNPKFTFKNNGYTTYGMPGEYNYPASTSAQPSTECPLFPGLENCDTYTTLSQDIVVGNSNNSIFCLRELRKYSTYCTFWGSYHTQGIGLSSTLISSAAPPPRLVNSGIELELYTLTKGSSGVYNLNKSIFRKEANSWVTVNVTFLCSFPGSTLVSEMDLSRNDRYLAWGDMGSGKLFVYDLSVGGTAGLKTLTVPATKVYGVEFSANANYLYFAKYAGASPGVGVYNLSANAFAADVPSTADLQSSQLELSIDGNVYGYSGTQLKGFASENYQAGIIKTYSISNPLSSYGVYTLVDQIDNLDYGNIFTYYGCKQTEYITGNVAGVKNYSAAVSTVSVSTTNIANGATVNVNAGKYITFNPGFNTSLTSTGYLRAVIQPCGQSSSYCTTYRTEEAFSEDETTMVAYPNPVTSGYLNFVKKARHYKLINSSGIEVLEGKDVEGISVEYLAKGLYLLDLDGKVLRIVIE